MIFLFLVAIENCIEVFLDREVRRNKTVSEVDLRALSHIAIIVLIFKKYYKVESMKDIICS